MINFRLLIILSSAFWLLSCGSLVSNDISGGISRRISLGYQGPALSPVCNPLNNNIYTGISVSGTAEYEYREVSVEIGSKGLREIASTPRPIRHAEYVVLNSSNQIVFCEYTDNSGNFSFNLPLNNELYTIEVRSRDETFVNVMRAPETNDLYKLSLSITANGNQTNLNLLAEADDEKIKGAAFNIFDQIVKAAEKVSELTLSLNCLNNTLCKDITEAGKANVYWEAGFNPGVYLNEDPVLSFFNAEFSRLFILGGVSGDVAFSDTDHFDNSIIIHEYFHFLESSLSTTNSPGGFHNGNQLLDPRLAWSEGVAQFFQAVVTETPAVLDTIGNIDGNTGFFLNLSIEDRTNDAPLNLGEGDFREFSIARVLWDLYDDVNDSPFDESIDISGTLRDANNNYLEFFNHFWIALTGDNDGLNSNSHRIRSFALMNQIIEANTSAPLNATWKKVLAEELNYNGDSYTHVNGILDADRDPMNPLDPVDTNDTTFTRDYRGQYGQKLTTCGGSTSTRHMIAPFFCNGDFTGSGPCVNQNAVYSHHMVQNSDYYHLSHSGGSFSLSFSDQTYDPLGAKADLDVYIYPTSYLLYGVPNQFRTSPTYSFLSNNSNNGNYTATETETISGVPAGDYLMQVFVKNFSSTTDLISYSFNGLCVEN